MRGRRSTSVPRLPVLVLPIAAHPFSAFGDYGIHLFFTPHFLGDVGYQFIGVVAVTSRTKRLEIPRVVRTPSGTGNDVMDLEALVTGTALAMSKGWIEDLHSAPLEIHSAILTNILVTAKDGRFDLRPKNSPHQVGSVIGIG